MIEAILAVWGKLGAFQEFVSAVGLALVTAFALWLFRAKVKLVWGSTSANFHQFKLSEEGNLISIWTEKFFIQNLGRKAASRVEIVFSERLTSYNLWPPRDHSAKVLENGEFVIAVPSVAPRELLIVDMIDIDSRSPKLLSVNCPDALTQPVSFMVTRQFGNLINAFIAYLMLAGLVGSIYLALRLLLSE